jgi:hypothetical protein
MQQYAKPSHVIVTPFSPRCAWCREAHGLPQGDGSHTSCDEHAVLIRLEHKILQFERTASYVERFKNGREAS